MGWKRNLLAEGAQVDAENTGDARMAYIFDSYVDPLIIGSNPQAFLGGDSGFEPLPPRGSPHPLNSAYKLDRYQVTSNGKTSEVVGLYSNDGRFRFPQPEPDETTGEEEGLYSSTSEEIRVEYPYAKRVSMRGVAPTNLVGPLQPAVLALGAKYLLETIRRRMLRVVIRANEIALCEQRMDEQNKRLHKINGAFYRFQAGNVDYYRTVDGVKYFQTTYSWWSDPGTRDAASPILPNIGDLGHGVWEVYNPQPRAAPANSPFSGFGEMTRLPFHEFQVFEQSNVNDIDEPLPFFHQFCPYVVEVDGWKRLPGL